MMEAIEDNMISALRCWMAGSTDLLLWIRQERTIPPRNECDVCVMLVVCFFAIESVIWIWRLSHFASDLSSGNFTSHFLCSCSYFEQCVGDFTARTSHASRYPLVWKSESVIFINTRTNLVRVSCYTCSILRSWFCNYPRVCEEMRYGLSPMYKSTRNAC